MARVPLDHPRSLLVRLTEAYSRRKFGRVVDPAKVMLHNRAVLMTLAVTETGVARWHSLSPAVQALAQMAASASIGCSWCLDYGYWDSHHRGVNRRKLEDVPRWRDSDAYTELERRVLDYAEAMTATPPTVTDAMVAGLREHLDDKQLVELTSLIAVENMRSRTNAALGLTSQGFRDLCDLDRA